MVIGFGRAAVHGIDGVVEPGQIDIDHHGCPLGRFDRLLVGLVEQNTLALGQPERAMVVVVLVLAHQGDPDFAITLFGLFEIDRGMREGHHLGLVDDDGGKFGFEIAIGAKPADRAQAGSMLVEYCPEFRNIVELLRIAITKHKLGYVFILRHYGILPENDM